MTDDLVKRLRMVTGFIRFETGDRIAASACLSEEAADRIEQLAAINEELEAAVDWQIGRAEAAEAKLAKAVEALDDALLTGYFGGNQDEHSRLWGVYEELTGGKDESN